MTECPITLIPFDNNQLVIILDSITMHLKNGINICPVCRSWIK